MWYNVTGQIVMVSVLVILGVDKAFQLINKHQNKNKVVGIRMSIQLTDTQQVSYAISGVDGKGAPATLPAGTTYVFTVPVASDGSAPGIFTPDANNPSQGILVAGAAGASGAIDTTATLPDGTIFSTIDSFTVISDVPVGIVGTFGTPESIPTT